jgi:hypothetical protein
MDSADKPGEPCEYQRCGGRGHRKTDVHRLARLTVTVDGVAYRVCEGCADLMLRDLRAQGRNVERLSDA